MRRGFHLTYGGVLCFIAAAMKRRLYFDTSVFGGIFDHEFRDASLKLFDKVKAGEVVCLYSEVVAGELDRSPYKVRKFVDRLSKKNKRKLNVSYEVETLARKYLSEKVVEVGNYKDCLHIALATVHRVEILVSWNFKHIVNTSRITAYNKINLNSGYKEINICSPKELLTHEGKNQKKKKGI
jgi:predicted nucleic acid-binding protein